MNPGLAIVGMACCYPDARTPQELWENVLAQRQAFRRLPSERLDLADYLSPDHTAPDCTYASEAALLEGYAFDRIRFRVAGSTFRSTDLSHWLALDVAAQALADAGFVDGEGLPRETTGVVLGNTLTGEFSRANLMRLRWPYVRRVLQAALAEHGWSSANMQTFMESLEARYKAPFPPLGEESLAGGLSNTIAGRICNHFHLQGGGYTVDGACASSLLAVTTACTALVAGDLDVALAGGVDLSLDPFELVGFAKAGALAAAEMRVYDAQSTGFWPGEGCGFVVLMRYPDALAQGCRIYAVLRGWGVSSDGSGGITRPEAAGQLLAVQRAYRRAGFGIDTVTYFEGHGTGTSVGDATELQVLSQARHNAVSATSPAIIGSIKANIGHTKAAAGIAGLLKATLALQQQLLPPTTGCAQPHAALNGPVPALQVLSQGTVWPAERPLRAGVSAMGFGGINTHVVLEGVATTRRQAIAPHERALLTAAQDAELLFLGGEDSPTLRRQVQRLRTLAARLSRAEVSDLAAHLATTRQEQRLRAALVVSSPAALAQALETLEGWLASGITARLDMQAGVYLGMASTPPRLGFVFPGQGSPAPRSGGLWGRRFASVQALYERVVLPTAGEASSTALAQPAIVTASLAALSVLARLGVTACLAIGHSLGELTALHWAGALDETALVRLATARGQAMAALNSPAGAMASIAAEPLTVEGLLQGLPVVLAGFNAPQQTVIAGEASAVAIASARAQARHLRVVPLAVSHAFHSPLVADAVPALAAHLAQETFRPVQRSLVSTVTGRYLPSDADLPALLCRQVTAPVRFSEAVASVAEEIDLWLEVGPGAVLSSLLSACVATPVVALDAGGSSLCGLLRALGAAYALGAAVDSGAVFSERYTRPFDLAWQPRFFVNPCELAPPGEANQRVQSQPARRADAEESFLPTSQRLSMHGTPRDLMRQLVAARAELPLSAVHDTSRLLGDLHLNSITVSQIIAEAARCLGLPAPLAPTDYANATVAEAAQALEQLLCMGGLPAETESTRIPAGVETWVRPYTVTLEERPRALWRRSSATQSWRVLAPAGHPLRTPLQEAFAQACGGGVVVCLPPEPDERHLGLLLDGAQAVYTTRMSGDEALQFVLVQHGGGAASFARTLHLECPAVATCVVDVPLDHPQAPTWVLAEAMAVRGYAEAHYDASGTRREPVLRLLAVPETPESLPLGPRDVLCVTGGGKGIAAECAFALACETGVRLALLGRSQPATDAELAANLARLEAAGVIFRYLPTDVTNAGAVHAALREVEAALGPVTAIIHGAGTNVPQLLSSLDVAAIRRTLAPKLYGAGNLLAAVNPAHLRLFITFGSIIARTGMRGEADYALANEWLARLTARVQAEHPSCRCLNLEWSIWSGVGMGERLGRVEALQREGITPISPDVGLAMLRSLLAQPLPAVSVLVTGRLGETPTLRSAPPELPFWRFLEQPRVYYPGVELVVEASLSVDTDPYMNDHVFQGERLFPAVLGLEAMAQTAMALAATEHLPVFEEVLFRRPVVLQGETPVTLRLAALMRTPGCVEVVLRSSETAFQVEHFRAICCFRRPEATLATSTLFDRLPEVDLALDPGRDLYGTLLFQGGRFQRLQAYRQLRATSCVATLKPSSTSDWFGRYLPATLVLGDPGRRDATLHAIQACIPQAPLLPIGVERLSLAARPGTGPMLVCARERVYQHGTFTYDVEVLDAAGCVQERWEGLQLRQLTTAPPACWAAPLLGVYCERRLSELLPEARLAVVLTPASRHTGTEPQRLLQRRTRTDQALQQALAANATIWRRPDGKPAVLEKPALAVSAAHTEALTLAVAGPGPLLGCDVEPIMARPASLWRDLLGTERYQLAAVLSQETGASLHQAATRLWAAGECIKKAGGMLQTPLCLASNSADGWVVLTAGILRIATLVTTVQEGGDQVVLAFLVGNDTRVVQERLCVPTNTVT